MHIIFVYNSKSMRTRLNKVLVNGGLKRAYKKFQEKYRQRLS